jgi:hypothetical protein
MVPNGHGEGAMCDLLLSSFVARLASTMSGFQNYKAYLVRLWQDSQHGPWRASVQSAQTGEKVLFASLAELFAFLEEQTEPRPADDPASAAPPET